MSDSISANGLVTGISPPRSLDRWLRARLLSRLAGVRGGRLIVDDFSGTARLGHRVGSEGDPDVRIEVLDPAFYRAVASNGSVGAGRAYMDGLWRCDDLVGLVRLLVRNRDRLDGLESGIARAGAWCLRAWHALRRNTRAGAVKNIVAHYDLSPEFFALFLSTDLMYSSALWSGEDDTLEAASVRKLERICQQLNLQSSDHVCEIGSGWGGFAFYAAERYGCRVTTCTISRQQYAYVRQQIEARDLSDRVCVLLTDYRDLTGRFDKLVSIEMIEAIGAEYLEVYFAKVARLLHADGRALIQAITIEDHRYAQALASVDYIKRYIFPGSFIPSVQAIMTAKMNACDLYLSHAEDFGDSYARTLRAWRMQFLARLPDVRALGFDEHFIRKWEYYLAYCEGGFLERSIGVSHLLFVKPRIGS